MAVSKDSNKLIEEAMSKRLLPFKSTLERYHMFGVLAEELKRYSKSKEGDEIRKCKFYEFDEAFEEYCHSKERCKKEGKRDNDFDSKEECWKCPFREVKPNG